MIRKTALQLAFLLMFNLVAKGQALKLEPESPAWNSEVVITADPLANLYSFQTHFFRSDTLFATMATEHRGLRRYRYVKMTWNGSKFVSRMTVPEGCEWGQVFLSTNEKYLNVSRIFLPRTNTGVLPPGALIAGLIYGGHERDNWKSDIDTELAKDRNMGWTYKQIWRLRYLAMKNMTGDDLRKEIESIAKSNGGAPDFLLSIAHGYFLLGLAPEAFAILERLCHQHPSSPYAINALNDAEYQVFSHDWEEMKPRLSALRGQIANGAPENPGLINDSESVIRLVARASGITTENMRKLFDAWRVRRPDSMDPYLVMADALFKNSGAVDEVGQLVTKAIELSYLPHPGSTSDDFKRGTAYRLRSRFREATGDLVGAIVDAKLAQAFAPRGSSEDLDAEADLWRRLGYPDKAEATAMEAYKLGSVRSELFARSLYLERTGSENGFQEYFLGKIAGQPPDKGLTSAPNFKATRLDGTLIDLRNLRGEVVVLNFWFISCGPCRGEMPELNKLVEEFKDLVHFVAFASDSAADLKEFLKTNSFKCDIVPGTGVAFEGDYKVKAFPSHVLIDRNGKIAWEAQGANPENIKSLRAMIQRVLPGNQP